MRCRLCLSVALAIAVVLPARAQEMRPLSELASTAAESYSFIRCGGLYQAIMEWAGRTRLGDETWTKFEARRMSTLTAATVVAVKDQTGSFEHAAEMVARDARNVADLYEARFEANFAREGQAFATDKLVAADSEFCKTVTALSHEINRANGLE